MNDTPETTDWFYKPHNRDEGWDRIDIRQVPRWKDSELSGDEWRFLWEAVAYRKGVAVKRVQGRDLPIVLAYINAEAQESFQRIDPALCMQPTCELPATNHGRIKKQYDRQGYELVRGTGGDHAARVFCEDHKHRGDCALEDADINYEWVGDKSSTVDHWDPRCPVRHNPDVPVPHNCGGGDNR